MLSDYKYLTRYIGWNVTGHNHLAFNLTKTMNKFPPHVGGACALSFQLDCQATSEDNTSAKTDASIVTFVAGWKTRGKSG